MSLMNYLADKTNSGVGKVHVLCLLQSLFCKLQSIHDVVIIFLSTYLGQELEVLLHQGEVRVDHESGVEELILRLPHVVGPVAWQHVGQHDATWPISWQKAES